MRWFIPAIAVFCVGCAGTSDAPPSDDARLVALLEAHPVTKARLENAAGHRIQVLWSEVVPGPDGPRLSRRSYRLGAEYFYPASTIKLCAALAVLEWLHEQKDPSAPNLTTPFRIHPLTDKRQDRRCGSEGAERSPDARTSAREAVRSFGQPGLQLLL